MIRDAGFGLFETGIFVYAWSMRAFWKIQVWHEAHSLALSVYQATAPFPRDERYELTAQLRRAALSVATNLAEGSKRESSVEFARFVNISEGSLAEAQYLLLFSRDMGYLTTDKYDTLIAETRRLARRLHAFKESVRKGGSFQPSALGLKQSV